MKCLICNRECKNYISLSKHLPIHKITSEQYYRQYINDDNKCKICGKPTRFVSISYGYKDTCCSKCAVAYGSDKRKETCLKRYGTENPAKNKEIRQKISNTVKSEECQERTKATCRQRYGSDYVNQSDIIKNSFKHVTNSKKGHATRNIESEQFEKENNCIHIGKLIQRYGQGWLSIKNTLHILKHKGYTYIDNNDIIHIQNYKNYQSKPEEDLYNFIKSIYNDKIIRHSRSIIKPYELDIYLPNINLAIEYNSTWYHSIEAGTNTDYHLMKSLLCRKKNIRLIHIYEFENIEEQKQLLKDLILGIDKYPKNDFNKNNFLKIPKPELIYISDRNYHIYGAGKLYKKEEI